MKKIFSAIVSFLLIFCILSDIAAMAAMPEGRDVAIWVDDASVTAGDTFTVAVQARALENIATLSLVLYYNSSYFELVSAHPQSMITSNSGDMNSINSKTEGAVTLDFLSATGISGDGVLWTLTFKALSATPSGKYNFDIAVGEVYSASLLPISVISSGGKITVNSPVQSNKAIYFYSYASSSALSKGERSVVTFYSPELNGLSAGDFEIEYDHSLLSLVDVTLGESLISASNAVYSINSSSPGYIKISYIAPNGIYGGAYPFIELTFEAVQNCDASAEIALKPSNIYDHNLKAMTSIENNISLSVVRTEEEEILPQFYITSYEGLDDRFILDLIIPEGTGLAAADFVINFDPSILNCLSVDRLNNNQMVISNINNDTGEIRFSFVDQDGVKNGCSIAYFTFSTTGLSGGNVSLDFVGKNMVDANFKAINATFLSGQVVVHKHGEAATCTTDEICSVPGCGKVLKSRLGHDTVYHEAKAPTCTSSGYHAYEDCTRCSYTTYEEIPQLNHSYGNWVIIDHATCTETGEERHDCERCDHFETREIKATGHQYENGHCQCGHQYGDIDGDNQINAVDVAYLNAFRNGKIALDESVWRAYDTNGNGKIDQSEIQALLVYVLGLPSVTSNMD
jgi:hypothetical protein